MKTQSTPTKPADAISLLMKDHAEVKQLFADYDKLGERAFVAKKRLAGQICHALTLHAMAEEEIFYPAVEAEGDEEKDMTDEAQVEHASAKELIAQILAMEPEDELYDAKVKVLSEQIAHHVEEEEGQMFPKARKDKLDLDELGERIAARKDEIEEENM